MVQSMIIPDNATQQEVDSLVCICLVTILMCSAFCYSVRQKIILLSRPYGVVLQ